MTDARKPWPGNARRYANALESLLREYMPWRVLEIGPVPTLVFPTPTQEEVLAQAVQRVASQMVTTVARSSAALWRQRVQGTTSAQRLYALLRTEMFTPVGRRVRELLDRQRKLIQRLPDTLARDASKFIARSQRQGLRAGALAEELRKQLPRLSRSSIQLLARTEVGRTETALTQARSEQLGLPCYVWTTSEDQRVRPAHAKLDGVLVAWTDAPNPEQLAGEKGSFGHYHPGSIYNCRCLALPLVSLDEIRWPHKVYTHGQIQTVSRTAFERWLKSL